MAEEQRWSICPVEDCEFAQEFDPNAAAFCPDCGMELISECPSCKSPVRLESQVNCNECGLPFKE
jgi:predicted RNA-binding Zn-ribbon protein involved in translation (DUF1610 family)